MLRTKPSGSTYTGHRRALCQGPGTAGHEGRPATDGQREFRKGSGLSTQTGRGALWGAEQEGLVQFSSVTQLCPALDCSMPGLPVHHQLPEFTQTMSVKSVMPSSHLILCCPLLLMPSIFPSIRIFSNESVLYIRGLSIGVSASAAVLPMNIQDRFPLGWTGWISLQSKGLSRVFCNTTVQKHQFFGLSFLYSPTLTSIHDYWRVTSYQNLSVGEGWDPAHRGSRAETEASPANHRTSSTTGRSFPSWAGRAWGGAGVGVTPTCPWRCSGEGPWPAVKVLLGDTQLSLD